MKMKRMTKYGIYSSSSANIIVLLIMKYSSIIYIFIYLYLFILIEGQSLNQYSFPSGGYSGDDNNYNIQGTKT